MGKTGSNFLFLAAGVALGAAIGYVVASDKKEEWLKEASDVVDKLKCNVKNALSKSKSDLDELID